MWLQQEACYVATQQEKKFQIEQNFMQPYIFKSILQQSVAKQQ